MKLPPTVWLGDIHGYTESQMRQAIKDALEEAMDKNWTEILREDQLVTWGDAETLGYRVVETLLKLKESV
jgi:hypothetical protein